MRIVAPFGFYGAGNIGDEATLNGFAKLLSGSSVEAQVWVGSRNPAHTARVEPAFGYFSSVSRDPRRWLAMLRATAQAVVGGTPIMDIEGDWPLSELTPLVRSAYRRKVPLSFIGVGTETLRRERSRRIVAEEIAPRVCHWSVRCECDRQRLVAYGVSDGAITVAADLAWLLEPATDKFGRRQLQQWGADLQRPLIGVNLVNESSLFDWQPELADALAGALDEIARNWDAQVVFLANEVREYAQFDKATASRVISRMKRTERALLAPNQYLAPNQMMSVVGCCQLTMSMRYHFCMFSALQGVPFVAIERSDKVADLSWDLDWPASVSPSRLRAGDLIEHAMRFRENATSVRGQLRHSAEGMRQRALRNLVAVGALADGRGVPPVAQSPVRQ